MRQTLLIIVAAFVAGMVGGGLLHSLAIGDVRAEPVSQAPQAFTSQPDVAAPADHIPERNISVLADEVVIKVPGAVWAKFTPSGSMVPVLDTGSNAIEIIPTEPSQIQMGDIISYQSEWLETPVIHRVIQTGVDEQGWYAVVKGDNNDTADPGKVRFSQVRRLVVAIIY